MSLLSSLSTMECSPLYIQVSMELYRGMVFPYSVSFALEGIGEGYSYGLMLQ